MPLTSKDLPVADCSSSAVSGITPTVSTETETSSTADEGRSSSNGDKELKGHDEQNSPLRMRSQHAGGDSTGRAATRSDGITVDAPEGYASPRFPAILYYRSGWSGDDVDYEWGGGAQTSPRTPCSRVLTDEAVLEQERPQAKVGRYSEKVGFSRIDFPPGFGHYDTQQTFASPALTVHAPSSMVGRGQPSANGDATPLLTSLSGYTAYTPSQGASVHVADEEHDTKGSGGGGGLLIGHELNPSKQSVSSSKDLEDAAKAMAGGGPEPSPFPWKEMLRSPAAWAVVAGNVAAGTAMNVVINWLPSYYKALVHVDLVDIGLGAQVRFRKGGGDIGMGGGG